ncbi:hypothetical protein [Dyella silvatica]|uniref:hypothetical protein n=1 Tax=Dyella silvatica TaxID=2992128 RepID=UPI002255EF7A|nr:hypothetical protein [Dyella silvatica]
MDQETKLLASLGAVGLLIGFAKTLASGEHVKWYVALARAVLTAALSIFAAFAVVLFPSLNFPGYVALACGLASLGTSALERIFQRIFGAPNGGQ